MCLSHPSRSHPIYLFLLGRIILLISEYLLFNTIYIAHYLSFVCEYLCVFVRLDRSVHLEVLGKQGLENDSVCCRNRELLVVNLGQMGHFIVYKHHYMSMVILYQPLSKT